MSTPSSERNKPAVCESVNPTIVLLVGLWVTGTIFQLMPTPIESLHDYHHSASEQPKKPSLADDPNAKSTNPLFHSLRGE